MHRGVSFGAALLGITGLAIADNWPTWRGPNRDGVSKETGLPTSWSPSSNIAWKLPMPDVTGSTPVIWGDIIFMSTSENNGVWLWAIDRNKGDVKWKQQIAPSDEKVRKGNMSSPSPVTDGKTVWVMSGNGHVKAFDFTGKELWHRDFWKDYGRFGLNHGYGSSPLLLDDGLIVQVLHGFKTDDPSYVVKLDLKSGKTLWKVERPTDAQTESPDSYTTPTVITHNGKKQVIVTGGDYVTAHDPATGKELWRGGGLNPRGNPMNRIVASPVVYQNLIFVPTRVNPLQAFHPVAGGKPDLAWATPNGPDVPTPVSDGKYLYMINDRGIAYCFDLQSGKEIYAGQRIKPATYTSSPVLADGKIYMTNEEGQTIVLKAGPAFEVLAENNLEDYTLSSPAVSDGQIFLRTKTHLWAIGQRKSAARK
ncbi:MAG: PQQ-binding-like beta-propeller repeat protein [Bryobacterales bacterium]|nr:PQQ-binding-like beta-propeller repeat protein [Bryobacterales bacterium]